MAYIIYLLMIIGCSLTLNLNALNHNGGRPHRLSSSNVIKRISIGTPDKHEYTLNENDQDDAYDDNDDDDDDDDDVFLISGGYIPKNAKLTKYMVSIRTLKVTKYFGDNHFCTGVIISRYSILTTAHCLVDRYGVATKAHRLIVVAGCPERLKKGAKCIEYRVQRVVAHKNFHRHRGNDIAVLILDKIIPNANPDIKIMSLARYEPKINQSCKTLGWGQVYWDGPFSNVAIYVSLYIVPLEKCLKQYAGDPDGFICASSNYWYVGICRGDSGTPLICDEYLVGIATESRKCADWKPIAYTDISYYYPWILQATATGVILQPYEFLLFILLFSISTII